MIQQLNLLTYKYTSIEIDFKQIEEELNKIKKERFTLKQEIQQHLKVCEQLRTENDRLD